MAKSLTEMLKDESPEVIAEAEAKAQTMLCKLNMAEIRAELEKSQAEIAEAMGVKQPTVAGWERKGANLTLRTLKRYVEAGGGKLILNVEFPDGRIHGFGV